MAAEIGDAIKFLAAAGYAGLVIHHHDSRRGAGKIVGQGTMDKEFRPAHFLHILVPLSIREGALVDPLQQPHVHRAQGVPHIGMFHRRIDGSNPRDLAAGIGELLPWRLAIGDELQHAQRS